MGHLHICYIIYSICIDRRKCILPSWPQIYKPHYVINGCYVILTRESYPDSFVSIKYLSIYLCYVIFGYPSSHKIDWNAHKTAIKCPRKRPPNAHKNALKCTQRRRKNAHKNTYAQLMHHYNNVTLMYRYLKSCTIRLFSRQLFHGSRRPLLVLCMWSTVYRWIPLTDGQ